MAHDIVALVGPDARAQMERAVTPVVAAMMGSRILTIAAQVRELKAAGREICDLTVGDFAPEQFRIPRVLEDRVVEALRGGETNYPPAIGTVPLRAAIAGLYERELGMRYPVDGIIVASGARPVIFACWQMFTEPGDVTVSSVPMWNTSYYAQIFQTRHVFLPTTPETNFFPTAEALAPHVREARLMLLNSPLNPTGTVIDAGQLRDLCQCIVDENRRRGSGRPLMLLFDQVYWMLTFGGARHVHPVELVPEIAPYVVYVDAISKSFAATGLRLGWAALPTHIAGKMGALIGHIGAWAPRAEQVATAWFLANDTAIRDYHRGFLAQIELRLERLYSGIRALRTEGLPVDAVRPQGAIYLSLHVDLVGKGYASNEEIRSALLERAGLAVVPFQAFDLEEDSGWFRMSAGACSVADIDAALLRLRAMLG